MTMIRHSFLFLFFSMPVRLIADTAEKTSRFNTVETFSVMNMLNMIMGLVVVIALILGLAWILRKYGRLPANNQVDMKVLGGLSLGTRERAVLVQVEGRRLLLGVAPGRVETLHVMDEPLENSFDSKLGQAIEDQK
ncbi:MAG: flagellar biosynthetic protein FliO [Gammaproteobacteria bacterium]|nr:flagellar biosynthetic protein FliO [Gammaproteobacteria bacterium]